MPPKRYLSDLSPEDTGEEDRGVKKRKTHKHRGHIKSVLEGFKETLSPATSESLADFNIWEKRDNRRGVVGLNVKVLERRLEKLVSTMDPKALDANINDLDISLARKQDVFRDYINEVLQKGDDVVYRRVSETLDDLVEQIEAAREQLPGMPSYWMNCHRKANC